MTAAGHSRSFAAWRPGTALASVTGGFRRTGLARPCGPLAATCSGEPRVNGSLPHPVKGEGALAWLTGAALLAIPAD
jgi:hypothetical protein